MSSRELFHRTRKAMHNVHAMGAKADKADVDTIQAVCLQLKAYITELCAPVAINDHVDMLRAVLKDAHPNVDYTDAMIIVRDIADIIVTLDRLIVMHQGDDKKIRTDQVKILEAQTFCKYMAEVSDERGPQ